MRYPKECPVFETLGPRTVKIGTHTLVMPDLVVGESANQEFGLGIQCRRVDNQDACWWKPRRLRPLTPAARAMLAIARGAK